MRSFNRNFRNGRLSKAYHDFQASIDVRYIFSVRVVFVFAVMIWPIATSLLRRYENLIVYDAFCFYVRKHYLVLCCAKC